MEKYCSKCQNKLAEGDNFCTNCGEPVVQTVEPVNNQTSEVVATKTNGLAIASFVCSLVGLVLFGLVMGILAISFSIPAINHINTFKNEKGKGLATAGLVIGIVDVVFVIFYSIINAMM